MKSIFVMGTGVGVIVGVDVAVGAEVGLADGGIGVMVAIGVPAWHPPRVSKPSTKESIWSK